MSIAADTLSIRPSLLVSLPSVLIASYRPSCRRHSWHRRHNHRRCQLPPLVPRRRLSQARLSARTRIADMLADRNDALAVVLVSGCFCVSFSLFQAFFISCSCLATVIIARSVASSLQTIIDGELPMTPNTSLEPTGVGAVSYSLRISGWRESQVAGGSVLGR